MTKLKKVRSKTTVSEAIRGLVLRGLTNAEIWKRVQRRFKLPDAHRWYPAWYRADMVRQGLIGRREAHLHALGHGHKYKLANQPESAAA